MIIVDGVLLEPAWSTPAANDFLQRDPNEGAPPSELTEVRVLYDEKAIYVGVRLFDRDAGQIGRRLSRRDEEPDADTVQVYLDPRHDGRSGVMLEVTAAGVQRDALIFNDSSLDFSWDAVWESAVTVDERGWTAEIRIPLSQLRFSENESAWGINVARYIRRRNETDWLVLVPKREMHVASRMAELTGLGAIRPAPPTEVISHVVARDLGAVTASPTPGALVGALGVDLKAGIRSDLTVDATVNPDFAQVESDPAVVNLTAFETFLEERRPFFTESAPLFQTYGNPGGAFDASAPTLFYSRRIGQAPPENVNVTPLNHPTATPVLGAIKLGGSVGRYWKLALLDAVSGATTAPSIFGNGALAIETAPLTNYAAGRLLRTGERGGLGALATLVTRSLSAASTLDPFVPKQALVGGVDGYVFFDPAQEWVAGGQLSTSHLSWTPTMRASAGESGSGLTPAALIAAGLKHQPLATQSTVAILLAAEGGPLSHVSTGGPPSGVPGHGPPSENPGHGPPSGVPGVGPPSTVPGVGPPSTVPGVGPPATVPAPVANPAPGIANGASATNENTGSNRVLDLSQGELNGWSANANLHRNNGAVRVNLDAWAISPGFETNDVGFLPRSDIQGLQAQASWNKFDPDRLTRARSIGITKGWTRTFEGELQSDTVDAWTSATFLNYWSASLGLSIWRDALDATVTRGGPSVSTPAGRSWWASGGTDARSVLSLDAGAFHSWNDVGDWSSSGWANLTMKPTSNVSVSIGPAINRNESNAQYVTTAKDASTASAATHYVFATLHASDVALTMRVNVIATSRLSFQIYAQPFVASGQFTGFKELASPASDRFLRYGLDGGSIRYDSQTRRYLVQANSQPATAAFQFDNPDFNPALLDLHAVVRWEWQRGSTLYLVWTQQRSGSANLGSAGIRELSRPFNAPADNAVAAKLTYWFGR